MVISEHLATTMMAMCVCVCVCVDKGACVTRHCWREACGVEDSFGRVGVVAVGRECRKGTPCVVSDVASLARRAWRR